VVVAILSLQALSFGRSQRCCWEGVSYSRKGKKTGGDVEGRKEAMNRDTKKPGSIFASCAHRVPLGEYISLRSETCSAILRSGVHNHFWFLKNKGSI